MRFHIDKSAHWRIIRNSCDANQNPPPVIQQGDGFRFAPRSKTECDVKKLPNRLAFTPDEINRILPIGRAASYKLAHQIGARVGHRFVISRDALQRWLDGAGDDEK